MPDRWRTGLADRAGDVARVEHHAHVAPGANGAVVLTLDEAIASAQVEAVDAVVALANGFGAIGLAVGVVVTLPGDRDASRHNTIVVTDRRGRSLYRRRIRRDAPIDLHDLIEHVGDVADED